MRSHDRMVMVAGAVVLGGVGVLVGCSDSPTAPVGGRPEGVIERSDALVGRPYGAAVSAGDVVYVTRADNAQVARIDLPQLGVAGSVDVGWIPTYIAFNAAGTRAYVANQLDQTIGVIDVASNTQISTLSVSGDVFIALPNSQDTRLYVGTNDNRLYEIDRASGTVLRSVALAGAAQTLAWHPNGYLLYASTFSAGAAVEVDTRSMTITRTFVTGGTTQQVLVSGDATELFVADEALEKVDVFNLASGARVASIAVGGNAWGMALTPDERQLYVGLVLQGEVVVLDRTTRAVVRRIATGGMPRRIVFNQGGTLAVVTNEAGFVTYIR
jgi:YVTN family beta-propeller protein